MELLLPLESRNVSVDNTVLRGVGFRGGRYIDTPNVLPLMSAPATEVRGVHTPFQSDVFYPMRPYTVNYLDALTNPSTGATRLAVTPVQFKSIGFHATTGTLRQFSDMDFRLYYSNNVKTYGTRSIPALSAAPDIVQVSSSIQSGTAAFRVSVTGNPAAGIQGVWITYNPSSPVPWGIAGSGTWQSLDLTQDAEDSTLWKGSLPPGSTPAANVQYMVQAVNGVGLVTLDTNLGAYYIPGVDPVSQLKGLPTTVVLESPPLSSAYGTHIESRARLTTGILPISNAILTFGLGAQRVQATTDNTGEATAVLPIFQPPGVGELQVSFAGTPQAMASFASNPFMVTKQETKLSITPEPAVIQYSDRSSVVATLTDATGRRLSQRTVLFEVGGNSLGYLLPTITDYAGRAALDPISLPPGTYAITASFGGLLNFGLGQSVLIDDPTYNSSSQSAQLQVTPEDAALNYTGDTAKRYGVPVTLAATVTQADDGEPGNITLAQVRYTVLNSANSIVFTTVSPVNSAGHASATVSGLSPGRYMVTVNVIGSYFAAPPIVAPLMITRVRQYVPIVVNPSYQTRGQVIFAVD